MSAHNERRIRMRTVRVERWCATNGCAGLMVFTGTAYSDLHSYYTHRCDTCGRFENYVGRKYPRIEHEPA